MNKIEIALAGSLLVAFGIDAATVNLIDRLDTTETLTTPSCWDNGVAPTDAASASDDYLVEQKNDIRTPAGSVSFLCNSLTIGSTAVRIDLYQKEGDMSFANDGLKLVYARWWDWTGGDRTYTIDGPVSFSDECGSDYSCRFMTENGQDYVAHDFLGQVTAPAGAKFLLCGINSPATSHYGLRFSGDLSGFDGMMELGDQARLEVAETEMPGVIKSTGANVVISPVQGASGFSVGTLDLTDGTALEVALDRDTGASQTIVATKSFAATGVVRLTVRDEKYSVGSPVPMRKYLVLRLPTPYESSLASKFVFAPNDTQGENDFKVVVADDEQGGTAVYLERAAVVVRVPGQQTIEAGTTWSDGLEPHGEADYYSVDGGTFRFPGAWPYVFPGLSLTVCGEIVHQGSDCTVSNLIVKGSTILSNWHEADNKSTNQFAVAGTRIFRGDVHLLSGDEFRVESSHPLYYILDGNVTGGGVQFILRRLPLENPEQGVSPLYIELTGNNTFKSLLFARAEGATGFENGTVICFRNGNALGGDPGALADLTLVGDYTTLKALETTELSVMNRRIKMDSAAFEAPEGVTLTVRQPIMYNKGAIHKRGAGTLCLSGSRVLNTENPGIEVDAGWIKAGSVESFDGLLISFNGTGGIATSLPEDLPADVSSCGLKVTVPPVLDTADGLLHVRLDCATDVELVGRQTPIITMPESAADEFRGKIKVDKPRKGIVGKVSERANGDGSVTFLATFDTTGAVIILR